MLRFFCRFKKSSEKLFKLSSLQQAKLFSNIKNVKLSLKNVLFTRSKSNSKVHRIFTIYNTHFKATFKNQSSQKIIGFWLLLCSGMVFVAVILGGITRLTEAGLSMVTWKFLGEKLPITEALWKNEFEKYKAFPEFKMLNHNITIEEFKRIWWMEYAHRMWGRLIGTIFLIPACYFWISYSLSIPFKRRLIMFGSLICVQGLMGWYMVKSGLTSTFENPSDVPRVSQYRLAVHLTLAFILYGGLLHTALDFLILTPNYEQLNKTEQFRKQFKRFNALTYSLMVLTLLTVVSGAFVAGLDAGLIYNTFPKMCNKWIPDDLFLMKPLFKNITENPATVQYDHRILGLSVVMLTTFIGVLSKRYKLSTRVTMASTAVLCAAYLQAALGILTLVTHVPVHLAAFHQSGSLLLLSSLVWLNHELKHIRQLLK